MAIGDRAPARTKKAGRPRDCDILAFGDSERALRIRRAIIDLVRDLFIRDQVVFSSAPFANQFSSSQARWPGERGSRPISRLEGTILASAIGRDFSLLQSGAGQQPQQRVLFRPQVVSATLTPALVELGL